MCGDESNLPRPKKKQQKRVRTWRFSWNQEEIRRYERASVSDWRFAWEPWPEWAKKEIHNETKSFVVPPLLSPTALQTRIAKKYPHYLYGLRRRSELATTYGRQHNRNDKAPIQQQQQHKLSNQRTSPPNPDYHLHTTPQHTYTSLRINTTPDGEASRHPPTTKPVPAQMLQDKHLPAKINTANNEIPPTLPTVRETTGVHHNAHTDLFTVPHTFTHSSKGTAATNRAPNRCPML